MREPTQPGSDAVVDLPGADSLRACDAAPDGVAKWTIDPSIQRLVEALNAFDGIETIGSCGGHPEPSNGGQWPAGSWYAKFRVGKNARGWRALEFLVWLINNAYQRAEHHVTLYPTAPPPYLNTPGKVLTFALEGHDGEDATALANWMDQLRQKVYIPLTGRRPR